MKSSELNYWKEVIYWLLFFASNWLLLFAVFVNRFDKMKKDIKDLQEMIKSKSHE